MSLYSKQYLTQKLQQKNNQGIKDNTTINAMNTSKIVISSLKEQMSNIREGMSKLIKIKYQEALPINQNTLNKHLPINQKNYEQDIGQENKYMMQKLTPTQVKRIQQKIKFVEAQNNRLNNKVKELQNNKKIQKQNYFKKQFELEMHNKNLEITVQILKQKVQKIEQKVNKTKKKYHSNKNNQKNLIILNPIQPLQSLLNYQKQNNINIDWQHYQNLNKNNQGIIKNINKLEHKKQIIEEINNMQHFKLIQHLNEQLVKQEIRKLQKKYENINQYFQQ